MPRDSVSIILFLLFLLKKETTDHTFKILDNFGIREMFTSLEALSGLSYNGTTKLIVESNLVYAPD